MMPYALFMILLGFFISLCCFIVLIRPNKIIKRKKNNENPLWDNDDDLIGESEAEDKELINEGKLDERSLEVGDSEAERPLVNREDREYYQKLGEDLKKQDEAIEFLLRAAQENEQIEADNRHFELAKQTQKKQDEKNQENNRQLKKILNFKFRKKVAKKVAKENIQLDDEKIKMIKLKALGGRIK